VAAKTHLQHLCAEYQLGGSNYLARPSYDASAKMDGCVSQTDSDTVLEIIRKKLQRYGSGSGQWQHRRGRHYNPLP